LSTLGPIHCCRAYYYCRRCGHGLFPWDQRVGLTPKRLTPGAEQLVSLAGALSDSFEEAAERVLPELAGLRLAETTTERTTEAAGERVGAHLHRGCTFGPRHQSFAWYRDDRGRTCAYVSIDATGVRQQGPHGEAAEGRMPYVGMIYNPVPDLPATCPYQPPPAARMQARYLAGLYNLDELGLQLRRQAAQVGMEQAEQWIGLTDGGNGLEDFLRTNFPRDVELILDFWHVMEHVAELAKELHPGDDDQVQHLLQSWGATMKKEGGNGILAVLERLPVPLRKPTLRDQLAEVVGYLTKNRHRMDYPRYLANGWLIGSGAVESACKTVVGQRLKLAGMRWRPNGTDAVCHLRALFKSGSDQWQAFWARSVN